MNMLMRPVRGGSLVRGVLAAVLMPVAATLLALPFHGGNVVAGSLYILAVVGAVILGGLWSALAASALAFLGLNFFFTPPYHTFRVDKTEDLVALIVFLIVAAVVAALLARAFEERARASRRERESRLLNYFATKLLSEEPLDRVLNDFATALLDALGLARAEIHARAGDLAFDAMSERPGASDGSREDVSLVAGETTFGTLTAVRRGSLGTFTDADLSLLGVCARQIAVAVERARLDEKVETARVEAERNQLRAALFSSVTHDLRTPLSSIKASVTSLLDDAAVYDADQERELLRTVLEETDRLNGLVGNILDLARVRAGALVPTKELTGVDDVLDSVLHRMRLRLANVEVRTIVRPDVPDVPIDPVQIDQVLTNLLENAARFSPPGGEVLVTVSLWHGSVQVRVADQGPGIPSEDRERVFEPFYRRDVGNGRSGGGLGLAIARAVVLGHGGRIWIEGAPSGGTAAVFELPVADADPIQQEPGP